jgi:hypothetical protein
MHLFMPLPCLQIMPTGGPAKIPAFLRDSSNTAYMRPDITSVPGTLTTQARPQIISFHMSPCYDRCATIYEMKGVQARRSCPLRMIALPRGVPAAACTFLRIEHAAFR